jgi:hypothetical protein
MALFAARTTAEAVVAAERDALWDVLTDPALLAELTPFVRRISAMDELWFWEMSGLEVLGVGIAPAFTEQMTFREQERIEFRHAPPNGKRERAGVQGWYALADAEGGTHLATSLEVQLELPLPRLSAPAVNIAMKGVMATMGDRFAKNLLDHLEARG